MDHVITFGNVLWFIGGVAVFFAVIGFLFFALWLMNPFRTGH